jgi:hypothetical protein
MTTFDVTGWAKRNVWTTGDGSLTVRPGFRRIATPTSGRRWVGGFSIQNPWTLEVWHYIADVSTAGHDLVIRVLDDDFVEWQALQTGVDVIPRGFSFGVVEGEIMIGSPDMPTLWGYVGGPLAIATKVASDNPGTTAIDVPRGVVASVLNRIVIADGASLYISDPVAITGGSPRTFVAQNQNQRPGTIFGVHEGAGGNLVVVTSAGVYSLDPSAFAVQIVGSNGTDWRLVNRTEAYSYDSSANVKGRIYALTKRGYILADVEGGDEVRLDEPPVPLYSTDRIAAPDWRAARMYAGDEGPIVADAKIASGSSGPAMHFVSPDVSSWWIAGYAENIDMRGVLRDPDGDVMVLGADGVHVIEGNVDGNPGFDSAEKPRAVLFAVLPADPDDNPTMRRVTWAVTTEASAPGTSTADVNVEVRGERQIAQRTGTVTGTVPVDARCILIGTTAWGASGVWYQDTPLGAVRFDADFSSPEITLALSARGRFSPRVSIEVSKSAEKRTPTRGAT